MLPRINIFYILLLSIGLGLQLCWLVQGWVGEVEKQVP